MKIEVVSKESVRPSSPTPYDVKTYSLSRFDQLLPPIYVPILLCYSNLDGTGNSFGNEVFSESTRHRCNVLKRSLAETLTKYYPLAGRIKDDKSVECNDEGVDYIEARVFGIEVSEVIQLASSVNIDVMEPLLPFEPYGEPGSTFGLGLDLNSKALLKIQVNVFDCGGIVICAFFVHKIADAASFVNFVNDWAATARGAGDGGSCTGSDGDKPCYILSSLFPPITSTSFGGNHERKLKKHDTASRDIQIVTKRFVFKDFNIVKLKKLCIYGVNDKQEENTQRLPTRFEALTSLIWKCFMDVDHRSKVRQEDDNADSAPKQVQYGVSMSVNLRTRMTPPLPANTFGNMGDVAIAQVPHNLIGNNLHYPELVSKVRDAIKLINSDHVTALQSNNEISNIQKMRQKLSEDTSNDDNEHKSAVMLQFTSWSRFPIYEADFGWGKPVWASGSKIPIENMVMYMDTSLGDGIEAWVSLKQEDMVEFERHEELVAFAS